MFGFCPGRLARHEGEELARPLLRPRLTVALAAAHERRFMADKSRRVQAAATRHLRHSNGRPMAAPACLLEVMSRPQAGIRGGRVSGLTHWHSCRSMPSKSAGIITQTTAMVPACSAPAQSLMPSITPSATSAARRRAPAAQTQLGGAATAHLNRRGVALARRRLRVFPGHLATDFRDASWRRACSHR